MKLTINKQIGRRTYPFTFEGNNLFECIMESNKLSFPDVAECGICHKDNLRLNAYETKEEKYKYTNIVCECGATLTFGQPKENPNLFYLRRDENKKFDWKERDDSDSPRSSDSSENMTEEQISYIELLAGHVTLEQDVKDRLGRFVKAEKSSDEAESAIKYTCDLIREKEGTVPPRDLPF